MAELATIRVFEHARGRRYSAMLTTEDETPRTVSGDRHDDLTTAVLNVLAKYDNSRRWYPGKRGRPPAGRDIPGRLESRRRSKHRQRAAKPNLTNFPAGSRTPQHRERSVVF
jgi:hypothetical protein